MIFIRSWFRFYKDLCGKAFQRHLKPSASESHCDDLDPSVTPSGLKETKCEDSEWRKQPVSDQSAESNVKNMEAQYEELSKKAKHNRHQFISSIQFSSSYQPSLTEEIILYLLPLKQLNTLTHFTSLFNYRFREAEVGRCG